MIFQKYKKWIIIAAVLIISFIIYSTFFTGSREDDLLTSSVQQSSAEIVGSEIINALNQIESLKLDRDIFDDPVYRSLKDKSQDIAPEPIGKPNPFSPIGSSAPEPDAPEVEDIETEDVPETRRNSSSIINQPFVNPPVI